MALSSTETRDFSKVATDKDGRLIVIPAGAGGSGPALADPSDRFGRRLGRVDGIIPDQSELKRYTVAQPAAGAEWVRAVPAGVIWRLLLARATFTASAAVANRRAGVRVTDGTPTTLYTFPITQSMTASQVWEISAAQLGGWVSDTVGQRATAVLPDVPLLPGYVIRSQTLTTPAAGMDAGDQWSAVELYVAEYPV